MGKIYKDKIAFEIGRNDIDLGKEIFTVQQIEKDVDEYVKALGQLLSKVKRKHIESIEAYSECIDCLTGVDRINEWIDMYNDFLS